ncbi:hypothetical protein BC351_10400 [Paenibacillus ferrarius]|uniref:Uncharacterized protein n=1 Tax=Paenibacillus ferrarius TaxID=1469647 RepID=A0A1V4H8V9_9BACL|nr:hypothetical protein [Paenibacillus ferrarius]OPH47593.1 hypothetical protein BC351_10400 [Paenibacillus ferrarius]
MTNTKTAKEELIDLVVLHGEDPEFGEDENAEFWLVDMVKKHFTEFDCNAFLNGWTKLRDSFTKELCSFSEAIF